MNLQKWYVCWKASKIQGWLMHGESSVLFDLAIKFIPEHGVAAEIGSWKGKSSYILASVCKQKKAKLICIDTFQGNIDETNTNQGAYDEAKDDPHSFFSQHIKKNLEGLPVEYMMMTSYKAAKKLQIDSLDFCFIDGDHTKPVVYNDIKNFLPKVKTGGILLGHDYSSIPNPNNHVKESVDELIGKENITINHSIWQFQKK